MKRRLLNLLTLASLLLCAAAVALWLRSPFVSDRLAWGSARTSPHASVQWFTVRTSDGGLLLRWDRREYTGRPPRPKPWDEPSPTDLTWERSEPVSLAELYPPGSFLQRAGFRLTRSRTLYGSTAEAHDGRTLAFPFWAVAAASAVLPGALVLRKRTALRRARRGLCPACGYDLRATPARCPECGTITAPRVSQ
jgi:hypothetical protein